MDVRNMKTTDLIKLLADRDTGDLARKQIEIELTTRVNSGGAGTFNELSLGDWDDCA
jgi:hypothetical protein